MDARLKQPPQVRAGQPIALSAMLEAALEAFNEHGYHGATVRDIAGRVGVTVPALYYHHENKEAMLFSLLDAGITHIGALCDQVAESTPDPRERFDLLVECLVRYMAVSTKLAHLDAEIRSLSAKNRRTYSTKRARVESLLRTAVEDGIDSGAFHVADPAETVRAMLGMIQAITTWYRPGGDISLDRLVERYQSYAARLVGAA